MIYFRIFFKYKFPFSGDHNFFLVLLNAHYWSTKVHWFSTTEFSSNDLESHVFNNFFTDAKSLGIIHDVEIKHHTTDGTNLTPTPVLFSKGF